mmetsp:Transcript_6106/g.8277  ORF Transcript_6106/g.8277 Transcript_6106/m.8277 type:complete len:198 (-) Transcript_6106:122-715(-)|eukprot:CAMPEP_0196581456 /NCGR_PEP_ID=MMETSP1081-20130531/33971_1 /TAXON_ID=36882 /ORGANISM="Pyramimonas amylifera, Strain CCMP720" /LENGTH=197 /DNA_ID=CAMNT_0041901693 /DNA_START=103 /DNA_END=696 /DNA_ORIENTATION=-
MNTIRVFEGLRSVASKSERELSTGSYSSVRATTRLQVVAQRKVAKKVKVVLTKKVENVGELGALQDVSVGYFRNYLEPAGLATYATETILEEIKAKEAVKEAARQKVKAEAQMLATALTTIGKFSIKKTSGDDKTKLFGSVTAQDIVDAVKLQTNQDLDKKTIEVPDIREAGTYPISVKLHPEVTATFQLLVVGVRA